jgi:hypothetical protein
MGLYIYINMVIVCGDLIRLNACQLRTRLAYHYGLSFVQTWKEGLEKILKTQLENKIRASNQNTWCLRADRRGFPLLWDAEE